MEGVGNCTTCAQAELPQYCRTDDGTLPAGLCYVERFLSSAAGPARELVLNRWALLVGAVMILQFHVMPLLAHRCEDCNWTYGSRAIRTALGYTRKSSFARSLGRHIVILNIYYSKVYGEMESSVLRSKDQQPFIESIFFAFFESVILHKLFRMWQQKYNIDYDRQSAKGEELKCEVNTKFADFSVPWSFATITFVAQFMLFSIFILRMNGDEDTHCRCKMNIFHWFAAVLVTNVSGHGESGGTFQYSVWEYMRSESASTYKVMDHPVQYWTRWFCDGTINAFCREVLLCLAPVALSVSDRDDLVKDCLAIFFISKMDDIDPRPIDKTLQEWRAEVENGTGQDSEREFSDGRGSLDSLLPA